MSTDLHLPWHNEVWQRLVTARRENRIPHALLLSGVPGVGKSLLASRLALSLICPHPDSSGDACRRCADCHQVLAGCHPDFQQARPEEPGKAIKIDVVRALTARSMLAAQPGSYRVIIIAPADAMNHAAANALLKTLEEPASRTIIILATSQPHQLPATIRSRCQSIVVPVPSAAVGRDWLAGRLQRDDVDALLAISGGAPLRAIQAAEEEWLSADERLLQDLESLRRRRSNPMLVVEDWGKRPLNLLFDGFKRCLADLLRLASGVADAPIFHTRSRDRLQTMGQGIDLQGLYSMHDELLQLERESTHNLNPQMRLERLANAWLQLTRRGAR